MQPRRLLLAASLALLASCSSDKKTGPNNFNGSLAFTYSGGISGSFNAVGSFTTAGASTAEWAWAWRDDQTGAIILGAMEPRAGTSGRIDLLTMEIPRVTTGSSNVTASCTANACAELIIAFGMLQSNGADFLQDCFLTSGTLSLGSITASRVTGTFTGTGNCLTPTGATSSFTVTNGTFDAALLPTEP